MNRKVISVRKYKAGYEVRTEEVTIAMSPPVTMKSAYTPSGDYIGSSVWAHRLIVRRGIAPELRTPSNNVCSIGFNEAEQKWYGWSHRAIYGFGIGDRVKKGDVCASSGLTSLTVGFKAKTIDDAKLMAIAFADGVS